MPLILKPSTHQMAIEAPKVLKRRNGHAKRLEITSDLNNSETRLKAGQLLTLLDISHSELYRRIRSGKFPKSSGKGTRPFWTVGTLVQFQDAIRAIETFNQQ
jgi:hypothetical protein